MLLGKLLKKIKKRRLVRNNNPRVAGTNIIAVWRYKSIPIISREMRFTMLLTPIAALDAVAIIAPLMR